MAGETHTHGPRNDIPIVIFHKDHRLDPAGVNAGAEMATIHLARALVQRGERVFVAAQLPSKSWQRFAPHSDGVYYIDLGDNFDTQRVFLELDQKFKLDRYDIIVASRAQALLESRYNSAVRTRVFISHEPSAGALGVQPSVIGKVADAVICVSNAQRDGMIQAGCDPTKILVIPNGADAELFSAGDSGKRDYKKLAFVGALVIDKGVHLLVEAFYKLSARIPGLTLDVYGSAKLWGREDFFDVQAAAQIPGIKFHGAVGQEVIAKAFREAGLLVLPSIWFDSFPLTAVEAQISGLPVLGSVNGGMKEIIQDGVTGKLLSDITADSLANAIERLVSCPAELQQMSEQSLKRVRPFYSWDRTAQEVTSVLQKYKCISAPLWTKHFAATAQDRTIMDESGVDVMQAVKDTPRAGVLTTYNQACGLATYASYLLKQLPQDSTIVLAEEIAQSEQIAPDGSNVFRCWKRGSTDYTALSRVIDQQRLQVVHLNCHYRFFDGASFSQFLAAVRAKAVKVIAHIHNPFTLDSALQALVSSVDQVIVHTEENRLEVIANGAKPENIFVLEHGVEQLGAQGDRSAVRASLGIRAEDKVVVCFGFVQVHKGIEEVIDAVYRLRSKIPNLKLFIVGGAHIEDATSVEYLRALKNMVKGGALEEQVIFLDTFVAEEEVNDYLVAADTVVMNYRSQYFEASGAVARALGAGCAIITSTAPAFARLGSTVWHVTSGYPLLLSLDLLLTNDALNQSLRERARHFAEKNSWKNISRTVQQLYRTLVGGSAEQIKDTSTGTSGVAGTSGNASRSSLSTRPILSKDLRVLMQNRHNAFAQRGGDTVMMERLAEALRERGVQVMIDVDGKADTSKFDVVHLFNFATPQITQAFAERCVSTGTPFVVSTLYEDLPSFFMQKIALFKSLQSYITSGQPKERWSEFAAEAKRFQPSSKWENTWTAENAAMLLATGSREAAKIKSDYPASKRVEVLPVGSDLKPGDVTADLFANRYGVKDFVLCVGRLETRKNQLMLLKALEDSDIPVVFLTGGFTYQPEYEAACRNFKRVGKTYFIERLDSDMLRSAYACAKVHALPSWYELPGLVSLEAAAFGKNVVVTDNGTARDYFGDLAYYCAPDDAVSIYNAVMGAYYAPVRRGLVEVATRWSWGTSAEQLIAFYEEIRREKPMATSTDSKQSGIIDPLGVRAVGSSGSVQTSTGANPTFGTATFGAATLGNAASGTTSGSDRLGQALTGIQTASDSAQQASQSVSMIPRLLDSGVQPAGLQAQVSVEGGSGEQAGDTQRAEQLCEEGDALIRGNRVELAVSKYQESTRIAPRFGRAYRALGVVYLGQEQYALSESNFNLALSLNALDTKAITGLGAVRWGQGRQEDAYKLYLQAMEKNPTEQACLLHLINASYAMNKFSDLERALSRFVEHRPKNLDIQYCLAGCLYKQGKNGLARQVIERILETEPGHRDASELQRLLDKEASGAGRIGNPSMTTTFAGQVEQQLRRLEELKVAQDYDSLAAEAEQLIGNSSASSEQRSLARIFRGEALAFLGDMMGAEAQFREAEASGNYVYRALTGWGAVAAAQEKWAQAEDLFTKALQLVPDYDIALAGLGICAVNKGQIESAWGFYQRALTRNPENLRALLGLIQVGYPLKRLAETEAAILGYLEMHPANLSILYSYAGCCYAQGKFTEAKEQLQKIRLFDPAHKLANELLSRIDSEERVRMTA